MVVETPPVISFVLEKIHDVVVKKYAASVTNRSLYEKFLDIAKKLESSRLMLPVPLFHSKYDLTAHFEI